MKPDGLVVIVDSIQKGDQPGWDGLLDLFPHYFHEPYYAEYANGSLEAWGEAAGLKPIASERAFLSKVTALQPNDGVTSGASTAYVAARYGAWASFVRSHAFAVEHDARRRRSCTSNRWPFARDA